MSTAPLDPEHQPGRDCSHASLHVGQWYEEETDDIRTAVFVVLCNGKKTTMTYRWNDDSDNEDDDGMGLSQLGAPFWSTFKRTHDQESRALGEEKIDEMTDDDPMAFTRHVLGIAVPKAFEYLDLDWDLTDFALYDDEGAWQQQAAALFVRAKRGQTCRTGVSDPSPSPAAAVMAGPSQPDPARDPSQTPTWTTVYSSGDGTPDPPARGRRRDRLSGMLGRFSLGR